MVRRLRKGGAMLYVVMTAAILAVSGAALLRVVSSTSQSVGDSQRETQAEMVLDSSIDLCRALYRAEVLSVPYSGNQTVLGHTVACAISDSTQIAENTLEISVSVTIKGRNYVRKEYIGLPAKFYPNESEGLYGRYWQTDGTNDFWQWPPILSEPKFTRLDKTFNYSGPSETFMPNAPAPYVIWTGYLVPERTGSYQFAFEKDNHVGFWLDGVCIYDTFAGFSHLGYTGTSTTNTLTSNRYLQQGVPYRIKLIFMDYGGSGKIRFKWKIPGDSSFTYVPSSAMRPDVFLPASQGKWSIPVDPAGTYLKCDSGDTWSKNAVPVDLESLGLLPGDQVLIKSLGSWNAWGIPNFWGGSGNEHYKLTPMCGVFSSSSTINSTITDQNRVPGAIAVPGVTSLNTGDNDIPEDFLISNWGGGSNGATVTIPASAKYLFVSVPDSYFGDNTPSIDGVWNVTLERL